MKEHRFQEIKPGIRWCADCGTLSLNISGFQQNHYPWPKAERTAQDAVACYPNEAGELPAGAHPDEIHPRGDTWLAERANWENEVACLRSHIEEKDAKIQEQEHEITKMATAMGVAASALEYDAMDDFDEDDIITLADDDDEDRIGPPPQVPRQFRDALMNKLTDRARLALCYSANFAREYFYDTVQTGHLLLGLIRAGGKASSPLMAQGVTIARAKVAIAGTWPAQAENLTFGNLPCSVAMDKVLERVAKDNRGLLRGGDEGDILIALLEEDKACRELLALAGVTMETCRAVLNTKGRS